MNSFDEEDYYQHCLSQGIPYFGSIGWALQGLPSRHAYMQLLVKLECCGKEQKLFNILEVGTWAGGSAITWADAIKQFNNGEGRIVCVDSWVPYFDPAQSMSDLPEAAQLVYKEMSDALSEGTIYNLFEHNVKSSKHDDIILSFKGTSDDILPLLVNEFFNLVFIDGDHSYSTVSKDIKNAVRLIPEGGILCGDDLELQVSEIDLENAWKNCHMDYILDPKANEYFHPGVSLAVGEFFGQVSAWEGFWAMRKSGKNWEKVELPKLHSNEVVIPKHFSETERVKYELEQTQSELERSQSHLQQTQSELERSQFQVQQTQAELQQAQVELESLYGGYPNPTLLEEFGVYNLVAWRGSYYGLPKELGPVNISSDTLFELEGIFIARSLENLKNVIQDRLTLVSELEKSQSQLERTQTQLEQSQLKVERIQVKFRAIRARVKQIRTALRRSQAELQAIESSKFWQLRQAWFRLKRTIGLSKVEEDQALK